MCKEEQLPINISSYTYYMNYSDLPYNTGSFPLEADSISIFLIVL